MMRGTLLSAETVLFKPERYFVTKCIQTRFSRKTFYQERFFGKMYVICLSTIPKCTWDIHFYTVTVFCFKLLPGTFFHRMSYYERVLGNIIGSIAILMLLLDGRDIKQLRYVGSNVKLFNKEMSEFMITKQSVEMNTKELFMGMNDLCVWVWLHYFFNNACVKELLWSLII